MINKYFVFHEHVIVRVCVDFSYFSSLLAIVGHLFDGHHLIGVGVTCLEEKDVTFRNMEDKILNLPTITHTLILSHDLM